MPEMYKRPVSLFPKANAGEWESEMSLRDELKLIFSGDGPESGKAHWIKVRHFDKTSPSQYYNEETGEAVGGPMFNYVDTAVLTFYTLRPPLNFTTDALSNQPMGPGRFDSYHLVYYFEYNVAIDVDDMIFELDRESPTKPANLAAIGITKRFNVRYVHDFRGDNQGQIEYKGVLCRIDDVSYG